MNGYESEELGCSAQGPEWGGEIAEGKEGSVPASASVDSILMLNPSAISPFRLLAHDPEPITAPMPFDIRKLLPQSIQNSIQFFVFRNEVVRTDGSETLWIR